MSITAFMQSVKNVTSFIKFFLIQLMYIVLTKCERIRLLSFVLSSGNCCNTVASIRCAKANTFVIKGSCVL